MGWDDFTNAFTGSYQNARNIKARQDMFNKQLEEQQRKEREAKAQALRDQIQAKIDERKKLADQEQEKIKAIKAQGQWAKMANARWGAMLKKGEFDPTEFQVNMEQLTAIQDPAQAYKFINEVAAKRKKEIADQKAAQLKAQKETKPAKYERDEAIINEAAARVKSGEPWLNVLQSYPASIQDELTKARKSIDPAGWLKAKMVPGYDKILDAARQEKESGDELLQGGQPKTGLGGFLGIGQPAVPPDTLSFEQWQRQQPEYQDMMPQGQQQGQERDSSQLDAVIADLQRQAAENQKVIDRLKQGR